MRTACVPSNFKFRVLRFIPLYVTPVNALLFGAFFAFNNRQLANGRSVVAAFSSIQDKDQLKGREFKGNM